MRSGDWKSVYATLYGVAPEGQAVEGVENVFESGKVCERWYCDMLSAYERLHQYLENNGEDADDLEVILTTLSNIEKEMCMKMFEYGVRFGMEHG